MHGSAKLSAKCANGEVILGESNGLLNQSAKHMVTVHGAEWSWSGDAPEKHSGPFSLWIKVQGPLHCDVAFLLQNDQESNIAVDVFYKWSHIKPCPKQLKGCSQCPTDKCHQEDVAICDGSPYWECLPKEAARLQMNASLVGEVGKTSTEKQTTATTTTTTTTTATPKLSLDDLMEDPKVQSLLREEENLNKPDWAAGPLPTSHPAVTMRGMNLTFRQPMGGSKLASQERQHGIHLPWAPWYNGVVFAVCLFLAVAICISRAEPSEQVRGQLGAAIQGQRTPYSPIDAPPEQ